MAVRAEAIAGERRAAQKVRGMDGKGAGAGRGARTEQQRIGGRQAGHEARAARAEAIAGEGRRAKQKVGGMGEGFEGRRGVQAWL